MIEGRSVDKHHLVPKTYGGTDIQLVHRVCHGKIHHALDEKDLRDHYHTWGRLKEHTEIKKFIRWVKKKDPEYYTHHKDTAARKKR